MLLMLASESGHKGGNASSLRSSVMDEETMRMWMIVVVALSFPREL